MKNKKTGNASDVPSVKKKNRLWMALLLTIAALVILFLVYNKQSATNEENTPTVVQDASSIPAAPENLETMVNKLAGRWQRTDGGYIIELKNPSPGGKIDASYFNPNPINVGHSGWQHSAGKIIVSVELQDVNYPGSLYTLEYINNEDRLAGLYYQAVEKVNYNVSFTRIK